MRLATTEYQKLDLWAHSFLRDVPLHDAFVLDLPGGGQGLSMSDMRTVFSPEAAMTANPLVDILFKLRFFVGRIFGWDSETDQLNERSYIHRLDATERAESLIPPGTPDGPFRLVHLMPGESVSELQNATAHAFLCQALRESETGYRYYWGVYVKPTSRLTPLYMGLIKPFRHWIVYPSILRFIKKAWTSKFEGRSV